GAAAGDLRLADHKAGVNALINRRRKKWLELVTELRGICGSGMSRLRFGVFPGLQYGEMLPLSSALQPLQARVSRFLSHFVLQRDQNSCRSTSGGWSHFDIADDESWIRILGTRRCDPGNQSDRDDCKQARYRHFDFPRLLQKRFTSRTTPVYRHSRGHTDP